MDALVATYMLVFMRTVSLLTTLPVVSAQGIPRSFGVLLALGISVVLLPHVPVAELGFDRVLVMAVVYEVLLGGFAGLCVRAVFASLSMASELMGLQMGLAMAQLFDPLQKAQQGPVASIANWVAALSFLAADLHVAVLMALADGFQTLPPGQAVITADSMKVLIDVTGASFALGIQLSGPVLALVFMTNVLVGVLGKIAPRMNVFFSVGPTLTSIGGIALLAFALPSITRGILAALIEVIRLLPGILG